MGLIVIGKRAAGEAAEPIKILGKPFQRLGRRRVSNRASRAPICTQTFFYWRVACSARFVQAYGHKTVITPAHDQKSSFTLCSFARRARSVLTFVHSVVT